MLQQRVQVVQDYPSRVGTMTRLTRELLEGDGKHSKKSSFSRLFKGNRTHPGTASEADTTSHMVRQYPTTNEHQVFMCTVTRNNLERAIPTFIQLMRFTIIPTNNDTDIAEIAHISSVAIPVAGHSLQEEAGQDACSRHRSSTIRIFR